MGVVIRRVERYDLVKIKPTESEADHRKQGWEIMRQPVSNAREKSQVKSQRNFNDLNVFLNIICYLMP